MKSTYLYTMLCAFMSFHVTYGQQIDASPAGVMISHSHPKNGWMVTYTYMSSMMNDNLSGTGKVSDDDIFLKNYNMSPQKMRMDMHMLMAMYGLTGELSFMVMTSYNDFSMDMKAYAVTMHMHGGSMEMSTSLEHTHEASGLGDVKFWALYKLKNGEGSSLVLSAGLNLPVGDIRIDAGEHAIIPGERQPYMMQMGSGSFDFMPGLTYLKKSGKITWSVQALSVIRPFDNSVGYHYGNELTLNGWAAYNCCSLMSVSLRAEGFASDAIKGKDRLIYELSEPGSNPNNYGGIRANGYAGINFYVLKNFMKNSKIGIEFGMPFYQNLNGPQLASRYTLNAGITKSF